MTPPPLLPAVRSRRATYTLVLGVVSALLLAGLVVPFAFGEPPSATLSGAAQGPDPLDGGALTPSGGASVPGGLATDPAATGAVAGPAAASGVPGALGSSGAPSAAGSPTGAGAPSAATPGAAAPGAAVAAGGPARTASDQGITADTVKLGVFLIDLSKASSLGFDVAAYNPDRQKVYWKAYIDDVNARGGAGGRKIEPVFRSVDVLDSSTFTAQCKQITETDKVFAVTNILGFYGPPILCVTRDHQTPWLAYDGLVSSYYAASNGLAFTVGPSTLRTELNLADRLTQVGELTDAAGKPKVIGFLHEDGYLNEDNRAVMKWLSDRGHTVVEGLHSSSSSTNAATDLAVAADKFCRAGVTAVFLATNSLYAPQFVNDVDRFPGCQPAYYTSDFDFEMAGDTFLTGSNMPASYYRRALSVTGSRVGEGRVGMPEPAADARCRQVYEKASGQKLDRNSTADALYFTAMSSCALVDAFAAGVSGAGLNPTRRTFATALAQRGPFANPGFGDSSFSGGRTDAPTSIRIAQAYADCGDGSGKPCWKPREDFVRARY